MLWKAIKWGFGIMLGIAIAYVLFWTLLLGGLIALIAGASS
jgi:hypothetical protein